MPFLLSRNWFAVAKARRQLRLLAPIIATKRRDIRRLLQERNDVKAEQSACPKEEYDHNFPVRAEVLGRRSERLDISTEWYGMELETNREQLAELLELKRSFGETAGQEQNQNETEEEVNGERGRKKWFGWCCGCSSTPCVADEGEGEEGSPEQKWKAAKKDVKDLERNLLGDEEEIHRLKSAIAKAKDGDERKIEDNRRKMDSTQRRFNKRREDAEGKEEVLKEAQQLAFEARSKRCKETFEESLALFS